MRYVLAPQQKSLFDRQGFIELASLLTPEQMEQLFSALRDLLAKRLGSTPPFSTNWPPDQLLMAGHNCWQELPLLKKWIANAELASIAAELLGTSSLRLAYDQLLPSQRFGTPTLNPSVESAWQQLIREARPLSKISSLTEPQGGWLFPLGRIDGHPSEPLPAPWSLELGSALFFGAEWPIELLPLLAQGGSDYLLVCYGHGRSIYLPAPNDPHRHSYKKLGYAIGDRLRDQEHPLLVR